jgi:hypothetical protein
MAEVFHRYHAAAANLAFAAFYPKKTGLRVYRDRPSESAGKSSSF